MIICWSVSATEMLNRGAQILTVLFIVVFGTVTKNAWL